MPCALNTVQVYQMRTYTETDNEVKGHQGRHRMNSVNIDTLFCSPCLTVIKQMNFSLQKYSNESSVHFQHTFAIAYQKSDR